MNKSSSSTGSSGSPSTIGHGSSHPKPNNKSKSQLIVMTKWRWIFGFACLLIPAYLSYIGYLETRVNTPFDAKKVNISHLNFNVFACAWQMTNVLLSFKDGPTYATRVFGTFLGFISAWHIFWTENSRCRLTCIGFDVVFAIETWISWRRYSVSHFVHIDFSCTNFPYNRPFTLMTVVIP